MTELKAYKGDIYVPIYGSVTDAKVYLKSEADQVIAELKEQVQEERSANVDYKISARDLSNGLKEAQAELRGYAKMVKQLKANLDKQEGTNRRLKRALYKACANWADVEVFDRTVGIDDPNVEANRWALMRNKCLKKVEEYK
jgi:hypothetical protein